MRLNRYLSLCGISSRRGSEQVILDGRVAINGHIVRELATKVEDDDRVTVDAKPVRAALRERNVVRDILGEPGAAHESTD